MNIQTFIFIFWISSTQICLAQVQKFAIMQFDAGSEIKLLVINGFKSAECEKLISTFTSGLKMDCPQCKRDYANCTNDIGNFRVIWEKEKYSAPYVAAGNLRYLRTGEARKYLEQWCISVAEKFKSNGVDAVCIY